ncbi:MAG: methyltransferase domain-containing protein, partial [Dehalococcoidia bacterium]
MQETNDTVDAAYRAWRSETHRPAQGRRTAEQWAGFLLPRLKPTDRLLDIGCGPGSITFGLAAAVPDGEVVGVDTDAYAIESCTKLAEVRGITNIRFARADGRDLPFEAGEFDAVFLCAVLQHVGDPETVVAEARRVLRPGGLLAVTDADLGSAILWPEDATVTGWMELSERFRVADGGTPRIGRMLPGLLANSGFRDIHTNSQTRAFTGQDAVFQAAFWARQLRAAAL